MQTAIIDKLLEGLTAQQREAVELPSGCIIAGAGAGKTKTNVAKIALDQLIWEREQINRPQIVVTFTNAAADELRERLFKAGARVPYYVGTLHGLAFRWIREAWGKVEVVSDRHFADILAGEMKRTRIKVPMQALKEAIETGSARGNLALLVTAILNRFRSDRVVHPDMMLRIFHDLLSKKFGNQYGPYAVYVDEAQDSSAIDFSIYGALAAKNHLVLTGDPRQSVYAFRGARPDLFQKMIDSFGDGIVNLPQNFRSCVAVVEFANMIADQMDGLHGIEPMIPVTICRGIVKYLGEFEDTETEAGAVARWAPTAEGETTAVLCRYNATVDIVCNVLMGHGLKVNRGVAPEELAPELVKLSELTAIPRSWESAMLALGVSFKDAARLMPALERLTDPADIFEAVRGPSIESPVKGVIHVSTIHAAKGLEWDRVALVGADDAAFDREDAENIRLAYVAATRARLEFVYSSARTRSGRFSVHGRKLSPIFQ